LEVIEAVDRCVCACVRARFHLILTTSEYVGSRGSSVTIVTRLQARRPGLIPDRCWEFSYPPPRPERLWGPPSLLSIAYRQFSPEVKRP